MKYATRIPKPSGVDKNENRLRNNVVETVLKWQSENSIAQNRMIKKIDDNLTMVRDNLISIETKLESKMEISHQKT